MPVRQESGGGATVVTNKTEQEVEVRGPPLESKSKTRGGGTALHRRSTSEVKAATLSLQRMQGQGRVIIVL